MEIKEKIVKSNEDAKILYEDINKRIYKIVSVKDLNGCQVKFYDLPFALYVPEKNKEYVFEYAVRNR